MELADYIEKARPEFQVVCLRNISEFSRRLPSHPGQQKGPNGLAIHTVQVIEKALELNQGFSEQEIIETCLAHDLNCWQEFPLTPCQTTAVQATKGLPWKVWRKTPHYRFVALILIADMWSAYVNIQDK